MEGDIIVVHLIEEILHAYDLHPVNQIRVTRDQPKKNSIIQCQCDGKWYVVKRYQDGWTTKDKIQKSGEFNRYLADAGMPVAKMLDREECYSYLLSLNGESQLFSVEEYIDGKEIGEVTEAVVQQLGMLLAEQHVISEQSGYSFGYSSEWTLMEGARVAYEGVSENYECFLELVENAKAYGYEGSLLYQITDVYHEKRRMLEKMWNELPRGPIQGDWCPYNMVVDSTEKIVGIFDFNIAGDEAFVNELASLHAYYGERGSDLVQGYETIRPLNNIEKETYPVLLSVILPFRFDRTNSIIALMKAKEDKAVMEKLDETLTLLNQKSTT
ncbi:phosphotransferase [Priestia koreensis]|uniref:phosphotransferase n=1 Tax=Priestia koreensis TaxID=284581 RepID=UPI00203B05ED|nr:phosphotransferase [Priestia koreensis]